MQEIQDMLNRMDYLASKLTITLNEPPKAGEVSDMTIKFNDGKGNGGEQFKPTVVKEPIDASKTRQFAQATIDLNALKAGGGFKDGTTLQIGDTKYTFAIGANSKYQSAANVQELRGRYERNCRLLKKYPYLFRRDIPSFEELTIRFYPFDEVGYIPFYAAEERFGAYINFKNPVISRNFFKDLEGPVLADDVYSQYELEYLADNVRKSEYVGRENHIYLHYTN